MDHGRIAQLHQRPMSGLLFATIARPAFPTLICRVLDLLRDCSCIASRANNVAHGQSSTSEILWPTDRMPLKPGGHGSRRCVARTLRNQLRDQGKGSRRSSHSS
jgi:hypothetical protein